VRAKPHHYVLQKSETAALLQFQLGEGVVARMLVKGRTVHNMEKSAIYKSVMKSQALSTDSTICLEQQASYRIGSLCAAIPVGTRIAINLQ
jgi:hypothetical protein